MNQLDILQWFTSIQSPLLNEFARVFTFLGNKEFYFILLPLIYWCISKRFGFRLLYVLTLSLWINGILKVIFSITRPVGVDGVNTLFVESADGGSQFPNDSFPSGHAQGSTTLWGYAAHFVRRRIFWMLAIMLIFFTAICRLYTGIHWPIDVITGIMIGILILIVTTIIDPVISQLQASTKWILSILVPLLIFIFFQKQVGAVYSGLLLGIGVGYLLEQSLVEMKISKQLSKKVFAFLVGFIGIFVLYYLLGIVLPGQLFYQFIRYSIFGLWVVFIAPVIFVRLGIYKRN